METELGFAAGVVFGVVLFLVFIFAVCVMSGINNMRPPPRDPRFMLSDKERELMLRALEKNRAANSPPSNPARRAGGKQDKSQ